MIELAPKYPLPAAMIDETEILAQADAALRAPCPHITDHRAPLSAGGPNDYYSNGDYWWPNPETESGLPYIQRDGESNPQNFHQHRKTLRTLRTRVSALAAAYRLTGGAAYAEAACRMLREFFVDPRTAMRPSLQYAQAIPGVCEGRSIGLIDTLHLTEIPFAVEALRTSPEMTAALYESLRGWFSAYLQWMVESPLGLQEQRESNNHSVAYFVQVASFARFADRMDLVDFCRDAYRDRLLPRQMRGDGGFPLELARTKPYGYSIFVLDCMCNLCQLLSAPGNDLWEFETDGKSIRRGLEFLLPYLQDREAWPYRKDVMHFEEWPVRLPSMLFAGMALDWPEYLELYRRLPPPKGLEVRRNVAIRQPLLLL